MKIQSADMAFSAQHQFVKKHEVFESLKAWVGDRRPDFESDSRRGAALGDRVSLSSRGLAAAAQAQPQTAVEKSSASDPDKALDNDPRSLLIRLMVEALTGKKINVYSAEDMEIEVNSASLSSSSTTAQAVQATARQSAGYGVEYDYHESYYEAERTDFAASGVIKTADGQQIQFNLQLSMERTYSRESNVSIRAGDALRPQKDPLVINFAGPASQLRDTRFSFDIDADGKADNIPMLGANSGFLVLDRNGDGKVNDGKELFGTQSGDGFADLAALDGDGNGWIDDNDAVFAKLLAWSKDEAGNDSLMNLKDLGVGALYLGRVETPFSVRDAANDALGTVRESGVYVNENGSVGSLQHVDLSV